MFQKGCKSPFLASHDWSSTFNVWGCILLLLEWGAIGGRLSGLGGALVIVGAGLFCFYCFKVVNKRDEKHSEHINKYDVY